MPMLRVDFLVDGFNLYHSLKQASDDLEGAHTRWLDLRSLLTSYLPLFGKEAVLGRIYYFSALAHHLEKDSPGIVRRHQLYIEALRSTGVRPVMGGFKKMNPMRCTVCNTRVSRREEKKSDVAMAVTLLERLVKDDADLVVLVTGDTDQVPALHAAKALCPTKAVHCAFPYQRKNNELEREADGSFKMSRDNYCKHQFGETVVLKSGRKLVRPEKW